MKLVDSNVWLALVLSGHNHHEDAQDWLQTETASGELIFCRSTQQSFLRLLTTAAIFKPFGNPPLTNSEAWGVYQSFLADRRIAFAKEPDGLDACWQRLALRNTASPKVWMDAYLAAFAISRGYQLVTIDQAFRQFDDLDLLLLKEQ